METILELHRNTNRPITRPAQGRFLESEALNKLSHFQLADLIQRDVQGTRRSTRADTLYASIQSEDVVVRDIHLYFGEDDLLSDQFLNARNALIRIMPIRYETYQHWCLRLLAGLIGVSMSPLNSIKYEHPIQISGNSRIIFDLYVVRPGGDAIAAEAGAVEPDKIIAALERSLTAVIVLPFAGLSKSHCQGWTFLRGQSPTTEALSQPLVLGPADIGRGIERLTAPAFSALNN
jgi:hypothetical protein